MYDVFLQILCKIRIREAGCGGSISVASMSVLSFEYKQQKGVVARLSLLCCGWLPDSGCPHAAATAGIRILFIQKEKGAASRSIAQCSDTLGGTVTFKILFLLRKELTNRKLLG